MQLLPGLAACAATALIVSSVAFAQGALPRGVAEAGPLVRFTDEAALDRFASRVASEYERRGGGVEYLAAPPLPVPPPQIVPPPQMNVPLPSIALPNMAAQEFDAMAADDAAADSEPAPESITNTQVQGVDEGGIVKNAGDYLVVLRRGRLFTIRTGGDSLAPVDAINAFPPGKKDAGDAWYDEMLVFEDQVIVIGYSYGDEGTEINRFRLAADGALTYRDTYYLSSSDYYSDENYASRLMGGRLVFYTPLPIYWNDWRENLPALRRRLPGGRLGDPVRLMGARDIYMGADSFSRGVAPEILHTVTSCDLSAPQLACTAKAVAGAWSRSFYVSASAAYVWTEESYSGYGQGEDEKPIPAKLMRLPLDGSAPGMVAVSGGPVNQFSFDEDAADSVLRLVVRGGGRGDAMWASQFSHGETGLLSIPLASFQTGELGPDALRKLPNVAGEMFENRFVGRSLLYSATTYDDDAIRHRLLVVPFDGGAVHTVMLPHAANRLDVLGRDAVAIGADAQGGLGFTAVALGEVPQVESTFRLAGASQGESRSQAFFYRADPGTDGDSGTLGLPVSRQLARRGPLDFGRSAAILFLRRDNRQLSQAGELAAALRPPADDNCIASCVDWYGNARPIFLGGRVFALMGYELVEGTLADGQIAERRRVDFSPAR